MAEPTAISGSTAVVGERELATGFRLIGLKDVFEVTPGTGAAEFQRVVNDGHFGLVIASQAIRGQLTDAQRQHADASLKPLVVFVPTPSGSYEVESLSALAKRVLGVSLAMPK